MKRISNACIAILVLLFISISSKTSAASLALSGEGTSDSPYIVSSAADWNNLATYIAASCDDMMNRYIQVTADIDFTGDTIKPLGYDRVTPFNGDLDGCGKTISGYDIVADSAYFGAIAVVAGEQANIHDITVAGNVESEYSFCAGAIGFLYGSASNIVNTGTVTSTAGHATGVVGKCYGGMVTDCTNAGTVSSTGTNAGGVVGNAYAAVVTGCSNTGTVTASDIVPAGVVAVAQEGCTLTGCYNTGNVAYTGSDRASYASGVVGIGFYGDYVDCYNAGSVTAGDVGYIAGVMSYYYGDSIGNAINLVRCYNTADLTALTQLAGVVATGFPINSPVNMTDCYNTGNISSMENGGYAAGVIDYYTPRGTYTRCYNTGTIYSTSLCAGGVACYPYKTATDTTSIKFIGCYNTGDITADSPYAGGIAAYVNSYTTIDSCFNTGNVKSAYWQGGIGGYVGGDSTKILRCYNAGDITACSTTSAYAGGIAGTATSLIISDCFNTGNVTGTGMYVGGIAGFTSCTVNNVYNTGDLSGLMLVGGITGYHSTTTNLLNNAYNTGGVTQTFDSGDYHGAIIGNNREDSVILNTYYLNSVATGIYHDTLSVEMTCAELAMLDLGSAWVAGDNYTYPRIASLADNDYAKAYAAAVIPADGDTYASVTQNFYVGVPDGVTWSASPSYVAIDGNTATFTQDYTGTLTMTATSGDVSVSTDLTCNIGTADIGKIAADGVRNVTSEKFYTISGLQVDKPAGDAKNVYIVVRTYDDNTIETMKEVR